MTEVVGKDLLFRHVRRLTQLFHITPNIRSIKRIAVLRYEYGSAFYFLLLDILLQNLTKLFWQEYLPALALTVDFGNTARYCFNSNVAHLGHTDLFRCICNGFRHMKFYVCWVIFLIPS